MTKKWMSSGYLQSAPTGGIDNEQGIIEGVSVCTVGEAKGHGVNLDSEFIQEVERQGNAKRSGLKARFGHPNMCSTALGTFIGRFKNFRTVGAQVKADLFLSNEAKNTPHGDLHSYVLGMATNEPDMFGTSIVFTPGELYQRDADGAKVPVSDEYSADPDLPIYASCSELHACDTVDDPAANDGMFSRFSQETVAGQITEFLDLNPQVWEALSGNDNVVKALSQYGDKINEFMSKYKGYMDANQEQSKMETPVVEPVVEKLETVVTPDTAVPVEVVLEAPESVEVVEPEKPEGLNREQFTSISERFGKDVAVEVMLNGGDPAEMAYASAQAEIKTLKARIVELEEIKLNKPQPAKTSEVAEKKPLIRISGRG